MNDAEYELECMREYEEWQAMQPDRPKKTRGHVHLSTMGDVMAPACALVPTEELAELELSYFRKNVTCHACLYILDYISEEPERRHPPADKTRYQSLGMGDEVDLATHWESQRRVDRDKGV